MIINGVPIKDTYAEAFDFFGTRVIVTADTLDWAMAAAREAVGMGTSIIGCGGEAGIEAVSYTHLMRLWFTLRV